VAIQGTRTSLLPLDCFTPRPFGANGGFAMTSAPFQRYYEKMLSRYKKSDYPNRSPCWPRHPTTPSCGGAGGRKEPEPRKPGYGQPGSETGCLSGCFVKQTSEEGRLERCSHEHFERLVNDALLNKTSVCCVFEQRCLLYVK
jgi:hypothetical protein